MEPVSADHEGAIGYPIILAKTSVVLPAIKKEEEKIRSMEAL